MNQENIRVLESITSFKMINQGNAAEIYRYGENKILKLFRRGMSKEAVNAEYQKVSIIQSTINNIPKVYEIILFEDQYGLVYDRITGSDMIKVMLGKLYKLKFCARKLAHFHSDIHKNSLDVGYKVKEKLSNDIDLTDALSDADKERIKQYLKELSEGDKLCHFDFHPGNVMIRNNKPVIIDWMTACTGASNADVARTYLLLQYGELPHMNFLIRKLAGIIKKYIGKIYYEEYKRITGVSSSDIEQWILPVAAARLMEWLTDNEKEKLLKVVKNKLQCIE